MNGIQAVWGPWLLLGKGERSARLGHSPVPLAETSGAVSHDVPGQNGFKPLLCLPGTD
jgi:hypothetical protein